VSCGSYQNVHLGIQLGRDAAELVRGDAREATWNTGITIQHTDNMYDFRGPAVQGRRGDRFVYLTWGEVDGNGTFEMFRRAKLMLNRIDPDLIQSAIEHAGPLVASVHLTDACGMPRCARVDPPAIVWVAA
jgi:hypothetical protein